MKQIFLFGFIFFISLEAKSQSIHFASLSWRDALAKARNENKMLFIEMYTTWCTYCRQMEQTIFSNTEVGDYYNEHFINVRYDALKSDGIQIRKSYVLPGFPTFLYLDPNGLVILKKAGYQEKETFIGNGDSAFRLQQNKIHSSQRKVLE